MDKVKTLKTDAIVTLEIGADFYTRLQNLFYWLFDKDPEKFLATVEKFKSDIPLTEDFEEHLATMMALLSTFEQKADEQGMLITNEVESVVTPPTSTPSV